MQTIIKWQRVGVFTIGVVLQAERLALQDAVYQGSQARTPAMAAEQTDQVWPLSKWLAYPAVLGIEVSTRCLQYAHGVRLSRSVIEVLSASARENRDRSSEAQPEV